MINIKGIAIAQDGAMKEWQSHMTRSMTMEKS